VGRAGSPREPRANLPVKGNPMTKTPDAVPTPFDILAVAVLETGTCELNTADGKPLMGEGGRRCSITGYGPGFQAWEHAVEKRQERELQIARMDDGQGAALRDATAEFLADITLSFDNFSYNGLGPGHATFKAAYLDRRIGFIKDQWSSFQGRWGNFVAK